MKAELIDYMGSDLTCCNSARVSFDKKTELENGRLSDRDKKLIRYLAKHNHFTPFTHPQITLRYTVPIFIARQEMKHQIGLTRNEVSRRYVDDEPEFYVPDVWRSRPVGSVKQGSGFPLDRASNEYYQEYYDRLIEFVEEMYRQMICDGVAPEQARMVLPQSMYTSYYITGSLAAFARFYKQRSDTHAQFEIRELAEIVKSTIEPLYPVSWKALTEL